MSKEEKSLIDFVDRIVTDIEQEAAYINETGKNFEYLKGMEWCLGLIHKYISEREGDYVSDR